MDITVINKPLPLEQAISVANFIKGRLPTVDELLDIHLTNAQSRFKNMTFWTSEYKDSSNIWCVDKTLNIKVLQHKNCEHVHLAVVDEDDDTDEKERFPTTVKEHTTEGQHLSSPVMYYATNTLYIDDSIQ
jgi:hypothetical protein